MCLLFFKKKPKKTCKKCVYFGACGDPLRTEECDWKVTKKDLRRKERGEDDFE